MFSNEKQDYTVVKTLPLLDAQNTLSKMYEYPMEFFCPNGAQNDYIRAIGDSTRDTNVPVLLCTFANGVGKTTATIHTILNFVYGAQNGWFDYPIFHKFPYPKTVWYCSTAETIKNTVIPEMLRLMDEDSYTETKEGKPHISKITFNNGWTIVFKTYDQDPSTYESANVGVIVADEPMPESIWKAVKSRRRMGAITLLPMTPLYCPPYILDEVQAGVDEGKKGFYHVQADVYSACKNRGERGHLDAQIVDDMVDGYDPEEREARAFGKFMYFSGKIYPKLSRDAHFVDPSEHTIPPNSTIYQIVDPHDSRFSAVIWGAVTPEGRKIIFAEYPSDKARPYWDFKGGKNLDEEVDAWIAMEKTFGRKVNSRILDRHFGWQTRGQTNLAQLYAESGARKNKDISFISSYKANAGDGEIAYGHFQVRNALEPMKDGKPGLVIWNNCYHTWNGMNHYIRKHETSKLSSDKARADGKIVDKYKDFPDVVRYFVCAPQMHFAPEPVPMSKNQKIWHKINNPDDYEELGWQAT